MATIDQQFVEYIVKTLVNNPEKVSVERTIDEKGVLLSLTVDPEDIGRVIGRHGVTAQAMRVLLRALGTKQDARFNLKIENSDSVAAPKAGKEADAAEQLAEPVAEEVTDFAAPTEEPDAEPETEAEAEAEADSYDADDEPATSELAEKTRAELADLDDLDI